MSESREALIAPHVEEHRLRDMRQREEALRQLAEYEAEHGVIAAAELAALDAEWTCSHFAETILDPTEPAYKGYPCPRCRQMIRSDTGGAT